MLQYKNKRWSDDFPRFRFSSLPPSPRPGFRSRALLLSRAESESFRCWPRKLQRERERESFLEKFVSICDFLIAAFCSGSNIAFRCISGGRFSRDLWKNRTADSRARFISRDANYREVVVTAVDLGVETSTSRARWRGLAPSVPFSPFVLDKTL